MNTSIAAGLIRSETIAAGPAKRARIQSVDILRGLVIVIMALDHVRDFTSSYHGDPLDITHTTAILYATRWITHFCAPTFVFLAGVSAGFQQQSGKSKPVLSRFLLSRGLWLVFLELTIVRTAWFFDLMPSEFLQVIWAIGVSMVCLAGLVFLPRWAILAIGAGMVLGHNLLDGMGPTLMNPEAPGSLSDLAAVSWVILHNGGFLKFGPITTFVAYPLIPWIGVMALGYLFADFFKREEKQRRILFLQIGVAMIAAFFLLRGFNFYGDPSHWALQTSFDETLMSFFNVQKYPPSLLYLCATLGPAIVILSLAERWNGPIAEFLLVYGRVPLFFYILHLYLGHAAAIGLGMLQGYPLTALMSPMFMFPQKFGVGLPGVYAIWIAVVLALYFPCRWFGGVKRRSRAWWMSYF